MAVKMLRTKEKRCDQKHTKMHEYKLESKLQKRRNAPLYDE